MFVWSQIQSMCAVADLPGDMVWRSSEKYIDPSFQTFDFSTFLCACNCCRHPIWWLWCYPDTTKRSINWRYDKCIMAWPSKFSYIHVPSRSDYKQSRAHQTEWFERLPWQTNKIPASNMVTFSLKSTILTPLYKNINTINPLISGPWIFRNLDLTAYLHKKGIFNIFILVYQEIRTSEHQILAPDEKSICINVLQSRKACNICNLCTWERQFTRLLANNIRKCNRIDFF